MVMHVCLFVCLFVCLLVHSFAMFIVIHEYKSGCREIGTDV